ncbi:beta strand repeat-containing protein [Reyranella sp.]|uniref:beta strand repeat-containing protein n=1 Tax=Reyranella sp. TaxID=1929291 RepID=UPI003D139AEA
MANFTVTNLNDSGAGSLRAAIQGSNAGPAGVANTISFSPGLTGTITLISDLPAISRQTSIVSGSTTTGTAPTIGIDFNGHAGLVFAAGSDGSQLVGLSVGNANGHGITLNASHITLNNDYVGVALNGSALGNTGDGVYVSAGSAGNSIGYNPDAAAAVSNVISGNGGNGISLHSSLGNTIVSNRIGTSVDGTTAMANAGNGIWVTNHSNGNTIGGDAIGVNADGQPNDPTNDKGDGGPNGTQVIVAPPLGNLVSGNGKNGILIDQHSESNLLEGNFVGTDVTGNAALGNAGDGIAINDANRNSLIGCLFQDNPFVYYNVVSGNGGNGLHVTDSDNTTVQANFFGIGANNAVTVGNALNGILVDGSSTNTTVGGVIPLGNVSAGNGQNGIEVADTASGFTTFNTFGGLFAFYGAAPNGNDGLLITSTGGNQTVRTNVFSGNLNNGIEIAGDASGVTIVPNIVGLDTRGDAVLANGNNGVLVTDTAHGNTIGGVGASQGSVIRQNTFSGNVNYGLAITGEAYDNTVFSTAIGTDIQQIAALGNGAGGVLLSSSGGGNVIGTPQISSTPSPSPSDQYNIISGNTGNGITLGPDANRDSIVNNWIGLNIKGLLVLPNTGVAIQDDGTSNLIYGNAGVVIVGSGQSATGLFVTAPTTLEVYSGGTVNQTTISAGAMEVVSVHGTSNNTTVMRDGVLQLLGASAGGAVLGGTTTIQDGGALKAFGLGIASGATLSQQGGSTTAATVVDNGTITIARGTFDAATLSVGTTAKGAFAQRGGTATISGKLAVGGTADSYYWLKSGDLTSSSLAVATGAKFTQKGGTATFSTGMSTRGAISFASGRLTTTKLEVAVGGTFFQSSGTTTVTGAITDNGAMRLAGGVLGAASISVGTTAKGVFTQSGGTATISGKLAVGGTADSYYWLKSGDLTASGLAVTGGGKFSQTSGTATFQGAVLNNYSMRLAAGTFNATSLGIGTTARGGFWQTGGEAAIAGSLTVAGAGAGSNYTQQGGTLSASDLSVASGAKFIQKGGSTEISGGIVDNGSMSIANANLDTLALTVGATSRGTFTQESGTVAVAGAITIASNGTSADDSVLTLKGGTLDAGSLVIVDGGRFSQAGGTAMIEGNAINGDLLAVTGGMLSVGGDLDGTGTVSLGAATLHVDGAVSSGQSLAFASNVASLLELGDANTFRGTVAGMSTDDAIDLQDFSFAHTSILSVSGTGAANTYTAVTLTDGLQTAVFALYNQTANQYGLSTSDYALKSDGHPTSGTLFELAPGH